MYRAERLRKPTLTLMPWLAVVAKNVGVDYLRAHPNFVATGNRAPSERRGELLDPQPLPPGSRGPGTRPQLTREISARQMLDWARRNLPGDQCRALQLRIEHDKPDADIAREIGLATAEEAGRLVRAAEARLRRQFRGVEEGR
jgi:DNA-directed RNA polymerase specialized sigma24 family protein